MSVRLATLVVGEPEVTPTLSFRLEQLADGIALVAKHSEDGTSQTMLKIDHHPTTGVLRVRTLDLWARHLCEQCNVPLGGMVGVAQADPALL